MTGPRFFKHQWPFWTSRFALLIVLLLETGLSHAARIHTKNGRVIDGVVIGKGGGLVVIDAGGTRIELLEKDVARIEEGSAVQENLRLLGDDIRFHQWPQAEALAGKIRQMTLAPQEERQLEALVKIIEEGKQRQQRRELSALETSVIEEAGAVLWRSEDPKRAIEILRKAIAENADFSEARVQLVKCYEDWLKRRGVGWGSDPEALLAKTEHALTTGTLARAARREMVSDFVEAAQRIAIGKIMPPEGAAAGDELLAMAGLLESSDSAGTAELTDGILRKTVRARYYGKPSPTKEETVLAFALGYLWGKEWAKEKKPLEVILSKIEREHAEEFLSAGASAPDQMWQPLAAAVTLSQNAKFAEALKARDRESGRRCAQGLLALFPPPRSGEGPQVASEVSRGGPALRLPTGASKLRREDPAGLLGLVGTGDCPGSAALCLCLAQEISNTWPSLRKGMDKTAARIVGDVARDLTLRSRKGESLSALRTELEEWRQLAPDVTGKGDSAKLLARVRGEIDFEIAAGNALSSLDDRAKSAKGLNELKDLLAQATPLESKYSKSLVARDFGTLKESLIAKTREMLEIDAQVRAIALQEKARSAGLSPVRLKIDPIPPAENTDGSPEDDTLFLQLHRYNAKDEPVSCSGTLVVRVYEKALKVAVERIESDGLTTTHGRGQFYETATESYEYIDVSSNVSGWPESQDQPEAARLKVVQRVRTGDRFDRGRTVAVGTFQIPFTQTEGGILNVRFKATPYLPKGNVVVEATFVPWVGTISVDQVEDEGRVHEKAETRRVSGEPVTAIGDASVER